MEQMKISDYLENFNNKLKRGTCKVCRALVVWSRERVASHKRRNCMEPPSEQFQLHSRDDKKAAVEFLEDDDASDVRNDFKISDYLVNFTKETRRGNCKVCDTQVTWGKERVASHKRMRCTEPTPEVFLARNRAEQAASSAFSRPSRNVKKSFFEISDYLESFSVETKHGTCKACQMLVFWSRERVGSHKRNDCTQYSPEFFDFPSLEDKTSADFTEDVKPFKVQDYLENLDTNQKKGTCKVCKKLVVWSMGRLASHKRRNCTETPSNMFLDYKTAISRFNHTSTGPYIDVSVYLENFNGELKRGSCRVCHKMVTWSRDRLASHKRRSCTEQTPEIFLLTHSFEGKN